MKRKPKWDDNKIINEINKIKDKMGHFPSHNELIDLEEYSLRAAIIKNGGLNKFRLLFGDEIIQVQKGFWTENKIIDDLTIIKEKTGHFPLQKELINLGRHDLVSAITRNGGLNKFRILMGDALLRKPIGYWTDKIIIEDLSKIKSKIGYFPSYQELIDLGRSDLVNAIDKHGGINKFKTLLGDVSLIKHRGFWTDEVIINSLVKIINDVGHFPKYEEIIKLDMYGLLGAINNHGGLSKFRKLMGYEPLVKPDGFWSDETVVQDLSKIKDKIGHFPTQTELNNLNRQDLINQISIHGGMNKFRELCGEHTSLFQKYRSESASYTNKRGKSTENIMKSILQYYCKLNGYLEPSYYKKLSKGNVLEFICNTNKTIGIDVTNTRTLNGNTVRKKYRHKSYHLYLDELWIVVFSDIFRDPDYQFWNNESPPNVKVMSIDTFLKELDYQIDESTKSKINKYCSCTFHTKEELKTRI